MRRLLFLVMVALGGGERPRGTSYGYVPEDGEIITYKAEDRRDWRPFDLTSLLPKRKNKTIVRNNEDPYLYEPPVYGPPFEDGQTDPTVVPPSRDEFSTSGYSYDRPDIPFDLQPPQGDEIPEVPPPQYLPTAKTRHLNQNSPLQLEVNEMTCYDTPTDGRFQATMTFKSTNENVPVFEDATQNGVGCDIRSDAAPPRFNTRMQMNISKRDFQQCGIKECSAEGSELLCVRLRFPTVRRMRLPEDAVLTLQCRTRDKIAAHTKHLQFDVSNGVSARSSGVVARGGGRGALRSRAQLFRRGPRGDYSDPLPTNARVPLGDTLMLRTEIEPGDGWTSSRLSTVTMRGDRQEVALLQADGCRAPLAQALCPRDAAAASPLAQTLLIRAALFEGMRSGEEVRLSVRMVACLEADDCRMNQCSGRSRNKRHAADQVDSTSILSFKVVLPEEEAFVGDRNVPMVVMMLVLTTAIVSAAILIFFKTKGRVIN